MLPLQLAGLALAGRSLLSRYTGPVSSNKYPTRFKLPPFPAFRLPPPPEFRLPPFPKLPTPDISSLLKPVGKMFNDMTSIISQFTKKSTGDDYDAIVKNFLPGGSELLVPNTKHRFKKIQFADLDGDGQKELVASFKRNTGLGTIILKKQNEQWYKVAELSHPQYSTLQYRGFTDIAGNGRKQMLAGFISGENDRVLHGYSLDNGQINEMFSRGYGRFEVLNSKNQERVPGANLALWNRNASDTYDIELLRWNGLGLEPLANNLPYYSGNVIPYYVKKIKRTPNDPSYWYHLADALVKTNARKDARTAIEVGLSLDKKGTYKERFLWLKNSISK